jgi:hypothetical protein
MTHEEIINIAIECDAVFMDENASTYIFLEDLPEIVLAAIAHEREQCARVCENMDWCYDDKKDFAQAIRARGNQT